MAAAEERQVVAYRRKHVDDPAVFFPSVGEDCPTRSNARDTVTGHETSFARFDELLNALEQLFAFLELTGGR